MSIAEFIRESILHFRLKEAGCLAVYDVDTRKAGVFSRGRS